MTGKLLKINDYVVLLTNDDGWDAPGIVTIKNHLCVIGHPTVLAPQEPHSYCGHRVTTDVELRLIQTGPDAYSLSGSPADCVRVGLRSLLAGHTVDWVISGINRGREPGGGHLYVGHGGGG